MVIDFVSIFSEDRIYVLTAVAVQRCGFVYDEFIFPPDG